jgi:D-alanyl-D-alanine dipeptidase
MLNYIFVFFILIFQVSVHSIVASPEHDLKAGFISINEVDPSIVINLKYSSNDNLVGKSIEPKSAAILTKEAAQALRSVQEELSMMGFSLVIYDAYHSRRIYEEIEEWALSFTEEFSQQKDYFPNLSKKELLELGYLQNKRDHARGSTVDVSLIPINHKIKYPCNKQKRSYEGPKEIIYIDDGTIDMGSSYDLQDDLSCHECDKIHSKAKNNRKMLKEVMESHGFVANNRVWWQYTLKREPYSDTEFNFDV